MPVGLPPLAIHPLSVTSPAQPSCMVFADAVAIGAFMPRTDPGGRRSEPTVTQLTGVTQIHPK